MNLKSYGGRKKAFKMRVQKPGNGAPTGQIWDNLGNKINTRL